MGSIKKFIAIALGLMLFGQICIPALVFQLNRMTQGNDIVKQNRNANKVTTGIDYTVPDLTIVSGPQVIGMVNKALLGEYTLVVDGVTINNTTDIETVNLIGAAGLDYRITFERDQSTGVTTVVATH